MDITSRLRSSSAVIGNLPESPGYSGSVFLIDDIEARRIENDIDDGINEIINLRQELDCIRAKLNVAIKDT